MKVGLNLKPMLLTDAPEIPLGDDWLYEIKYDGFRCLLVWGKGEIYPVLKSRNDKVLNENFPEIINFCESIYEHIEPYLPLTLDGELVYLTNNFQGKFAVVKKRSKMKNAQTIESNAKTFPCHYIAFDILEIDGESKRNSRLNTRKQLLAELFKFLNLPTNVSYTDAKRLQAIDVFEDSLLIWNKVKTHNGEGVIAKKSTSEWLDSIRTKNWLKIKNWRYVNVVLTKLDKTNGYYNAAVYKDNLLFEVVTFKHGLKKEENETLNSLFNMYGILNGEVWELPASICITIACIDFEGGKIREPRFHSFQHQLDPTECNWQQMQRQLNPIPENVSVTNLEKPVFPACSLRKDDYLLYLQEVSSYMMPFLKDRLLTIIRYPHGVPGESFYQKNSPDNLPPFVATHKSEDTNFTICNNIETLIWLGNQLALEFHIPFQPIQTEKPTEIVFDLDPPVDEFHLAVSTALKMKVIFDQFQLKSFIKTSGGKGMQIYIPLPFNKFNYEETAIFTEFVCNFLVQQYPEWLTIERLKKNRGKRLYLDYVQHREGKTIVAPYSARGNANGLIATPLYWDEVNEHLKPGRFTMKNVIDRINTVGDPFRDFREVGEKQTFKLVLDQINGIG